MAAANVLLVKCEDGFVEVEGDPDSITANGRREDFISLPYTMEVVKAFTAASPVRRLIALRSWPRLAVVLDALPALAGADEPYGGRWQVGDRINVPTAVGESEAMRVVSLTVAEDDDGALSFAPELVTQVDVLERRLLRAIDRMNTGAQAGRTEQVATVRQRGTRVSAPRLIEAPPVSFPGALISVTAGPWVVPVRARLVRAVARLGTAGASETTINVKVNGVTQLTVAVAAGETEGSSFDTGAGFVDLDESDIVRVQVASPGAGAADCVVQLSITS